MASKSSLNSILNVLPKDKLKACPICHSSKSIIIARKGVLYKRIEGLTTIISNLCLSCGVIYTNPRILRETLNRFYQTEQAIHYTKRTVEQLVAAHESAKTFRRVSLIAPLLKPNVKILEIGCGNCNVAISLAKRFPKGQITGLEPSLDENMNPLANLQLIVDSINESRIPSNLSPPYNVIIAFNVLEHMQDQVQFIKQLRSILTPEGLLYLDVPNTYKPFWVGKNRIKMYFKAVHLFNYGRRSLGFLLRKSGFNPIFWDESEQQLLRVISKKVSKKAADITPQSLRKHEVSTIKRYFFMWKIYSTFHRICHRAFPLNYFAQLFWSLTWRFFCRNIISFGI